MANEQYQQLSEKWNRVLLNAFWVIFFIYFFCQLLFLVLSVYSLDDFDVMRFITVYIVIPDFFVVGFILIMEAIRKYTPRFQEQTILAGSLILSTCMVGFTSEELKGTFAVMILPLLVSTLYFNRRYLYTMLGLTVLAIAGLVTFDPARLELLEVFDMIIAGAVLFGAAFTGLGIIQKGEELHASLEKSLKSEQELLIKNIVMDRLSKIDALTDLYNHKTFHEYLDKLIEQRMENDFDLSLAVLDIDNFKQVNDTYGHWVGDLVLKEVAYTLKGKLDTDDFAARYGGEEFVAILVSKTPEHAEHIAEEIRKSIAAIPFAEMGDRTVTISIGLHHYQDGDSKEDIFKLADEALYRAKKTGKNRTVVA